MKNVLNTIMYILLGLMILAVASVVIQDGSGIIANLGNHIMGLFRRADLFNAEFIQLLLIAIFVGWAIRRFRKRR